MARYGSDKPMEPAFAWSAFYTVAAVYLPMAGFFAGSGWEGDPLVGKALLAVSGLYGLTAVAVAGAMGEPLPRRPQDGKPGLRLLVCWSLLRLLPPPVRPLRLALAALLGYVVFDASLVSGGAAALVGAASLMLGKPRRLDAMEFGESAFAGVLFLIALAGAIIAAGSEGPERWRGVWMLLAVLPLAAQRGREITALRWKELLPGVPPPPALDLSRYELSVSRSAPVERAPLPDGVEAQLVDTGSFRVDPARMLEKLRQYQLRDPRDFMLAWLRCAVASGATRIELRRSREALELRFDGRAFSSAELSQPYQVLVDGEGEDAQRGRHFAYGLLGLYRLRPRGVMVTSRGEDGVAAMSVGGPAADAGAAPPGTLIRVEWPLWALWWRSWLVAARAEERWGLAAASLSVDGRAVPGRPEERNGWRTIQKAGWRGAWRWRPFGRVRVYCQGTMIEELEDGPRGVEALLTHDELRLDISQSAVVRGAFLDRGLKIVAEKASP